MSRPSEFSAEVADVICARLVDGESLRAICEDDAMPGRSSVFRWLADRKEFRDQYARAREMQAEAMADEILEIADDGRNDWMLRNAGDDAGFVANGEALARSRLRVDTRKWIASKLLPKKYGDKIDVEHKGEVAHEVRWTIVDPAKP